MSPILLIDGRSGSGKTELATALRDLTGAQLVRMDALYPGWGGLEAGSRAVTSMLTDGRWREWDWASSRPGDWREVDLSQPLIVEGCGALSRANRELADHGVWVTLDDATRKRRALERDGELYAPHWDRWAAQEWSFIVRELPITLADESIDGRNVIDAVTRDVERWRAVLDPARVDG
ncbi:ATP-binding protein [Glaciihabitans arcticus]|uniref:ATP-binding protein n=1 Tax=Glaciihabitans arcticus TaxID=2668039 RepID=A0A4Q9GQK2_9MICO|nr:ATP-binding protein [Glaciihabitans arcticus]TBN57156.1 ATP-binding protein [Glaciihabitans arcticus]